MLHRAKGLKGYELDSLDGQIGKVKEFYFDDQHWTVRYLVADTGNWLTGKQVLISPYAVIAGAVEDRRIAVRLTKKQIEDSPLPISDKPVSRQFEEAYYVYHGWPMYWNGAYPWGHYPYPMPALEPARAQQAGDAKEAWDPHLRSTRDVTGHFIQAVDGEIGHVEDFVIDDKTWAIRYLIIDTRNWWPGKQVLVSPQWIGRVSWEESKVFVNLAREKIQQAPEFTSESLLTREYEDQLYQHYNSRGYWTAESEAHQPSN